MVMLTDTDYMKEAIPLALKGKGKTSPNPMVGCVIVKDNKIVAEGWHKYCGADHAEIMALKQAGEKAVGAAMYVTLEPCSHFGRTPPCVDKIIESGIKEIVIGMKDPNPLVNGKSILQLKRADIKTKVGILEGELTQINEAFIKYIKLKIPFIVAKCAQTLDGKIATATGESQWITSVKTRESAHQTRDEFDAICVGIKTVLKDNPGLNGVLKKNLKKIILDSSLQVPLNAKFFRGVDPSDCIIATTTKADSKKLRILRDRGISVLICPKKKGHIHLRWLFKELAKMDITSILIEGGAHVIGCALKENLVDKMHIYIAPKIIGDQKALSSVVGINTLKLEKAIQLKDLNVQKRGEDFFFTGYVHRNR